jgi:hypothetical protein
MKLLVLAALLAFFQSSVPPPRQSTNAHTGERQAVNDKASSNKAPTRQQSPVANAGASAVNENAGKPEAADKKQQQPVKISEIPPITVRTGRGDIVYLVFSGLLVVVGWLQVWLLLRTLVFVRRQAHEMKRQRGFMRLQWKSMREQAALMESQLSEMKSSGAQTAQLITHADNQVKALLASATAMQKSIGFQEAALEQWIDILDWKTDYRPQSEEVKLLRIRFNVVNPTNFPLTLKNARFQIVKGNSLTTVDFGQEMFVSPRVPRPVDVYIRLSDAEAKMYLESTLMFQVHGSFPHVGALKKLVLQSIDGIIQCGKGWVRFDTDVKVGEDENRRGQNPN